MKKTLITIFIVLVWCGIVFAGPPSAPQFSGSGDTTAADNETITGDWTFQDRIDLLDSGGTDKHVIKAVQESGLGGRLTIGLDETARTMVIADYGDIDVDLGLLAKSFPSLYGFNAAANAYWLLGFNDNSTNDDVPQLLFAESNGTAISILNIGDITALFAGDSTNDNATEPGIRLWNDTADSWSLWGANDDGPQITIGGNATSFSIPDLAISFPVVHTEDGGLITRHNVSVSSGASGLQGYADQVDSNNVFIEAAFPDGSGGIKAPGARRVITELYPAILTDTSTPHDLTVTECMDTEITTQGWNGTDDITFNLPDISAYDGSQGVLRVVFTDKVGMQDADTDFYIDPDASTQIILDLTPTGTDGDRIWNDNIGVWESIICKSTWTTALGGVWKCDTIGGTWADKGS